MKHTLELQILDFLFSWCINMMAHSSLFLSVWTRIRTGFTCPPSTMNRIISVTKKSLQANCYRLLSFWPHQDSISNVSHHQHSTDCLGVFYCPTSTFGADSKWRMGKLEHTGMVYKTQTSTIFHSHLRLQIKIL